MTTVYKIDDPNTGVKNYSKSGIIRAYSKFVEERASDDGFLTYLLSFGFKSINAGHEKTIEIMQNEVRRVYRGLVTNIERKPRSPSRASYLPFLLACPDLPEAKRRRAVTVDDHNIGFHQHCVLSIRKGSRIGNRLPEHLQEYKQMYLGKYGLITQIDIKAVTHSPGFVVDYVMKLYKKSPLGADCLLIMPESSSEQFTRAAF